MSPQTQDDHPESLASRGQILFVFAFFLTATVGITTLSIDFGVSFMERRATQNVAGADRGQGRLQALVHQSGGNRRQLLHSSPAR